MVHGALVRPIVRSNSCGLWTYLSISFGSLACRLDQLFSQFDGWDLTIRAGLGRSTFVSLLPTEAHTPSLSEEAEWRP
jgi:hypothetical protein